MHTGSTVFQSALFTCVVGRIFDLITYQKNYLHVLWGYMKKKKV